MMIPVLPPKSPDELLDYELDMTAELKGRGANGTDDAITAATWSIRALPPYGATAITIQTTSHDATIATVWLANGTNGSSYEVSAEMTTSGGRTYRRGFVLRVEDR